jgi:LmbE family N-acetylglucosaminyl deacetylase
MTGDTATGTLAGAPFESVIEAIGDVLGRVDPDVVVTLDATGYDSHRDRDHARIGAAAAEAVGRAATGATLYVQTSRTASSRTPNGDRASKQK